MVKEDVLFIHVLSLRSAWECSLSKMSQYISTVQFSMKAEFLARQKITRLRVETVMQTGQDERNCGSRRFSRH